MLEFERDEAKAASNLRKLGIALFLVGDSDGYGEERPSVTGVVNGIAIMVVHTERGDRIRLISAGRATRHERRIYEEQHPF